MEHSTGVRHIQGYKVTASRIVGDKEFVLAENPKAPQPFATWMRNIRNDGMSGQEKFFWGHYFSDREAAVSDFQQRVADEREVPGEKHPSVLKALKDYSAFAGKNRADRGEIGETEKTEKTGKGERNGTEQL